MKEYQVVDLSDFFEDCPDNYIFLVVYDVPTKIEDREIRKIKISEGRNVDTIYPAGKKLQVVIRDSDTGEISVNEPRVCRGIYRVDEVIENEFGWVEPVSNNEFNEVKHTIFTRYFKKIKYTEDAFIVSSKYGINVFLRDRLLEGTGLHVNTISLHGGIANVDDSLFEKILTRCEIQMMELGRYMDDLEDNQSVYISLDSMSVNVSSKLLMISKNLNKFDDVRESFSCTLSVQRVGIVSLVFAKIIKAENANELLKFLNEFFLE